MHWLFFSCCLVSQVQPSDISHLNIHHQGRSFSIFEGGGARGFALQNFSVTLFNNSSY